MMNGQTKPTDSESEDEELEFSQDQSEGSFESNEEYRYKDYSSSGLKGGELFSKIQDSSDFLNITKPMEEEIFPDNESDNMMEVDMHVLIVLISGFRLSQRLHLKMTMKMRRLNRTLESRISR